jgi:hypothetical protein
VGSRSFSEEISNVCKLIDNAQKDYQWNKEKLTEADGLTQDYLHSLELDNLKYEDRAKLATKLAKVRRERREYKDTIQVLEPLIMYLETDKGRQLSNLLKEALGKTRKVEEKMKTRKYCRRVLQNSLGKDMLR